MRRARAPARLRSRPLGGRPLAIGLVGVGLFLAACAENTAPGNDREAALSPPAAPTEVASLGEAIDGAAATLLFPGTLTEADLRVIPDVEDRCVFRFTRVGHPVLVYGSRAVLKLNDRLVSLPASGTGRYAAEGVTLTVRGLSEEGADGEPFVAELVLRLPDAPHERGYHGFAECGRAGG